MGMGRDLGAEEKKAICCVCSLVGFVSIFLIAFSFNIVDYDLWAVAIVKLATIQYSFTVITVD